MTAEHVSVLLDEVIQVLGGIREGTLVDGTVGQGGHSAALLGATPANVKLLAFDRDPEAIEASRARLAPWSDRVRLHHRGYEEVADVLVEEGVGQAAGVVVDLGLSSTQLASDRGFSIGDADAPLDMRFDPTEGPTAAEVIRETREELLAAGLREYGEFSGAGRLARRLKEDARRNRMNTVGEFVAACESVLGARVRKMPSAILPAQALRILTNHELDRLDAFLARLPEVLAPGGRAVLISFHSLEDRRVKRAFQEMGRSGGFRIATRKPVRPGLDELDRNRRSRSARLRVLERDAEVRS